MSEKTNVMRLLDQRKVNYRAHEYPHSEQTEAYSAVEVADYLDIDPARVFKTLVTESKSGQPYVFMIPAAATLDLKRAAAACGEKSLHMLRADRLLDLTGYPHGGCSPIGMKKRYKVWIDSSAARFSEIVFSAGKIGFQVEMSLRDLQRMVPIRETVLCES